MFGASPGDQILPMAMSPGDVVQVAWRSEIWGSDVAQRCWTVSPGVAEFVGAMSPGDVGLRVSDVASDVAIGRPDVACEGAPQSGVAQRSSFLSGDVAGDVVGSPDVAGEVADALGDVAWRCEGPLWSPATSHTPPPGPVMLTDGPHGPHTVGPYDPLF